MVKFIKEFLVIVSGVLVALVLESAWQDWMDQRLMGSYIKRLQAEIEFNLEEFKLDRQWAEIGCEAGQNAYDFLWTPDSIESDEGKLLLSTFVTALNREPQYRSSTYQDLVSTGRLSLIENPELRDQIISYYEGRPATEIWRPKIDNPYRDVVFRTVPPDWATEVVKCVTTDSAEYKTGWQECRIGPAGGTEKLISELNVRPQLRDHLAQRVYALCGYPTFLERSRQELIELQSALGGFSD